MKMTLVFEPDADLGTDPLDGAAQPRRLGQFWDTEAGHDIFLIVRERGEQFAGGSRTHVYPAGVWEHTSGKRIDKIVARLDRL